MAKRSENPTAQAIELDLNDDTIIIRKAGGRFELTLDQQRKWDRLKKSLNLTEAQLNRRIVSGYLDGLR